MVLAPTRHLPSRASGNPFAPQPPAPICLKDTDANTEVKAPAGATPRPPPLLQAIHEDHILTGRSDVILPRMALLPKAAINTTAGAVPVFGSTPSTPWESSSAPAVLQQLGSRTLVCWHSDPGPLLSRYCQNP